MITLDGDLEVGEGMPILNPINFSIQYIILAL